MCNHFVNVFFYIRNLVDIIELIPQYTRQRSVMVVKIILFIVGILSMLLVWCLFCYMILTTLLLFISDLFSISGGCSSKYLSHSGSKNDIS